MKTLLPILLFISIHAHANNYYFSNTGSDAAAGSLAAPWQTIAKFNSYFSSLSPGDSVLFKRGDTFYGEMIISRSGSLGSPIIISSYGTGAKPIITGFSTLSSWSAYSGNIYEQAVSVKTINIVTVNGAVQPMGRWPKTNAGRGGWKIVDSHTNNTSFKSSSIAGQPSYVGGELVMKKYEWVIDRARINAQAADSITYNPFISPNHTTFTYEPVDGHGWYIQNHVNTLTTQGEWAFDSTAQKIRMYLPGSNVIKYSTIDTLVYMTGKSYITFDNLSLTGANEKILQLSSSTNNINFNACDIQYSGMDCVFFGNNTMHHISFTGCNIAYANNNAFTVSSSPNVTMIGNTFNHNGAIIGAGQSGDGTYVTVSYFGKNGLFQNNVVKNSGYIGVHFVDDSVIIRNNFIDSFCLIKSDGGGVYAFGATANSGRKVISNVISNGISDTLGLGYTDNSPFNGQAYGVYMDGYSNGVIIDSNSIFNCQRSGIVANGGDNIYMRYNTLYNNIYHQMYISRGTTAVTNLISKHNILFSKQSRDLAIGIIMASNYMSALGAIDSNYYCRPVNEPTGVNSAGYSISPFSWDSFHDNGNMESVVNNVGNYYSIDTWKTFSSQDAHTVKTYATVADTSKIRFEYNPTNSPTAVNLGSNIYKDVAGATFSGLITLSAYSSKILLNPTPPTTYYISNAGSDAANGTTTSTPWQTINKINTSTFSPGDQVLFKRGDKWREQLAIPSSGTNGNPIVIGSYGTGAKPVINGADLLTTGWVSYGSNIWGNVSPNAVTTRAMVIIDDSIFAEASTIGGVTGGKYFIKTASTPDSLFVYSTTNPNSRVTEVSKREYAIVAQAADLRHDINITGIDVRYAGNAGIVFYGTQGGAQFVGRCVVDSCNSYANRLFGIAAYDGHGTDTFRNSKASYNGNGFYAWVSDNVLMQRDSTNDQIVYTVSPGTSDGGAFQSYQGSNWLVENCYSIRDNDAIHIDAGGVACNAIIRYNKVFNTKFGSPNTPGLGFGSVAAGGVVQFYYNLVVNPSSNGVETFTNSAGSIYFYNNSFFIGSGFGTDGSIYLSSAANVTFKNNIVARLDGVGKPLVEVIASIGTFDYNQYFQDTNAAAYRWYYGGNRTTLGQWQTATSQDAHSQAGDPLFVNNTSDWSLQATSPAINKGVDVGLTKDILGHNIVGLPDMGAYEFQPATNGLIIRRRVKTQ